VHPCGGESESLPFRLFRPYLLPSFLPQHSRAFVSELGPFLRHFAAELKRRRVLRVAGAYAAMSFVVAQVADIAFPALNLPAWTLTLVIVLLLIAFPFALVLAWIFDVTPDGLRRTDAPAAAPARSDLAAARNRGKTGPPAPPLFRSRAGGIAAAAGAMILALAAGAFILHDRDSAGGPDGAEADRDLSIAVLPFTNQSSDPDSEYFSDGLTEAIQLRLNRIGNLRVTSITSVMTYRGTGKQMRQIAAELGVDHVVEGSVRRVGDRVRISARLVEAATDRTLWSETLDRPFADLLDVETEIAEQVAAGLRLRLSAAQRGRLASAGTSSVAAYDLYMKARKIRREAVDLDWTSERATFYSVVSLLRQAVDADPEYAPAWAELSHLYQWHVDLPKAARDDSARVMAERAIRLAPDLPDGYVALGTVLRRGGAPAHPAAARQYELALERDPNHVRAMLAYAGLARAELRLVEQARLVHRAARLEPTNPDPAWTLQEIMYTLGDIEGALAWGERAMRLDPGRDELAWWWESEKAIIHLEAGNRAAAERHRARFHELAPDALAGWQRAARLHYLFEEYEAAVPLAERVAASVEGMPHVDGIVPGDKWWAWYGVGYALAAAGDTVRGHDFLRRAEDGNLAFRRLYCPETTCTNTALAMLYAYRGDADRAIEYLQHSIRVGWVGEYPGSPAMRRDFRNISGDPRYQQIMGDLIADFDRQRETLRREGVHRP
jgi:adenylate cyclase